MPFSYHSFQEIWRRAGGRENAKCFYCEVRHIDGFTLDCSHLDHARDENYDNPDRGILECLECHLKRHIHLYFFVLLKGKKKKSKECRFACMSLVFRIVAGEDRWDGKNIPSSKSDIKRNKKRISKIFSEQISEATIQAHEMGFEPKDIAWANEKVMLLKETI